MIIGGTGSLGQTLIKRFIKSRDDNDVIVVSRDEAKHWTIRNEYNANPRLTFSVGDIRDQSRMSKIIRDFKPNIIIMAAALKQVDTCERSPEESVKTNLSGILGVLDAVDLIESKTWLDSVLLVSTDKACEPINVYGMCKAISERLVTSRARSDSNIKFAAVRYGNVLESRGSILPLFKWQAENCENFTVTHKDMTRFIMTLDESVNLIENALGGMIESGSIMVPKLRAMKITDLAEIFAEMHGKGIVFTGIRPGEKMHESLIGISESIRVIENDDHFVIRSSLSDIDKVPVQFQFESSGPILPKEDLRNYLEEIGVLKMRSDQFVGRKIEEISPPITEKK
jgi:FlaA1/EpsC-like NDP-sugar epimerase